MATIKNVKLGDLLQNADASEMWLVTEAHKAAKFPEYKSVQGFVRICRTERANNRNWKWGWVRLKALTAPDQKDLVLYWDPREGEVGDLALRMSSYYAADRLFHPEEAKAVQDRLASQKGKEDFVRGFLEKFAEDIRWRPSPSSPACYDLTAWLHREPEWQASNVKVKLQACSWERTTETDIKNVEPYKFRWNFSTDASSVTCHLSLRNAETGGWGSDILDWDWVMDVVFPEK